MPLDPTLRELSDQQQQAPPSPSTQPRGLPPPQPTPYGIARAMEHQQQWAMPGINKQLGDITYKTAIEPINWANERAYTAMHGGISEESIKATDDLVSSLFGVGAATGVEKGALGALRMTRMAPEDVRIAINDYGSKDQWHLHSKETAKKMGELYTTFNNDTKQLTVNYMTGLFPEKHDPTKQLNQRSWGVGTHELQTLGPEILREYPNIDTLKFTRVGGVFEGNPTTLVYKRVDTPEGITFERIRSSRTGPRLGGGGWVPPSERFRPMEPTASPPSAVPSPSPPAAQPSQASLDADLQNLQRALPSEQENWQTRWDAMRQRQDAEWNALMQRLFGRNR